MKKVLIDSDICMDSFTGRYPHSIQSDKLLQKVEDGLLIGVVSAESFSNLYYILRKFSSHTKAINLLNQFQQIIQVGTVTPQVVKQALSSGWSDFEDALQHYCAIQESCDAIITRNISDYRKASLPVYSPGEWLDKH